MTVLKELGNFKRLLFKVSICFALDINESMSFVRYDNFNFNDLKLLLIDLIFISINFKDISVNNGFLKDVCMYVRLCVCVCVSTYVCLWSILYVKFF